MLARSNLRTQISQQITKGKESTEYEKLPEGGRES
jgi:hypothetical protein